MRRIGIVLCVFIFVGAGIFSWRSHWGESIARSPAGTGVPGSDQGAVKTADANVPPLDARARDAAFTRQFALERLAYAQAWDGPLPLASAAFHEWSARYVGAKGAALRLTLETEGVALARARRPEMRQMIARDPQRALAVTVPAVVRQALPSAVLAELETRVAGTGDYMWLETTSAEGSNAGSRARRVVSLNGVTYQAHAYGRRESQLTKEGASLHGITLEGQLALHESPVRVLDPGEIPATAADTHCPVSSLAVDPLPVGAGANLAALEVVEANGRLWEFCGGDGMLDPFVERLTRAEDQPGPRVRAEASGAADVATPAIAADAPTSHTIGTQQVLVIRVDFSDFPGDPISAQTAQDMMDNNVRPFLESASYGATTIASTISNRVYRLPQTASAYALADNETQLHVDARNAAAANYTLANFDRIIVVFINIGTSRIPNSKITFGGEGSVGGSNVWINGTFSFRILSHELGHTYGLKHANLWQVNDGSPVSATGGSAEYKDPFDAMGDSSTADSRFHYNQWDKNRLGWLPDSAVTTVTTSGIYRIFRFDHKDALSRNQPLALRVFRDGVRWYSIGYRQNFPTNAALTNGAYVVWGTNNLQQTQLLDLTTPGTNSSDAALAVGATFSDPLYGVTIKPVARGGSDPEQWLDVEVGVPTAAPPNVLAAWGRENAFFYDSAGLPTGPTPETYVPMGLTGVQSVAAGDRHAIALKSDGTVVVWGNDLLGQTGVPIGLADVVAVAAGGNVCGAIKRDGTVRLWGDSANGVTAVPAGILGVRQLAIGLTHALALKFDGSVVAWGSNSNGQSAVPAGLSNVIAIAAGDRMSIALKADGTVTRWGVNFSGVAFPTGLSGVVAISSLTGHVLALKSDGTVVAWGSDANRQSTVPPGLSGVVAIAAGGFHSLSLKADGTVVGWGSNVSGQLNVPADMPRGFALACSSVTSFALAGPHVFLLAQPETKVAALGGATRLSVLAAGSTGLSYQWRKDGVAIAGATGSSLSLSHLAAGDAANYDVVVTDSISASSATSAGARLTLTAAANVGRLVNLSIFTSVPVAGATFTMGTVIGGGDTDGTTPLLVRVAGPSLALFGIPDALTDPALEFFAGSTKIGENDNWGGTTVLSNAFASVGAFPYVSLTSKDAAILNAAVVRGNNSANSIRVSGVGGTIGAVIAELYDSTPSADFTATTPRLINVSVLKEIGSGFTVGFVIGGTTSRTVLVRAVGPGLAALGVGGVVLDPRLALYAGATKISENDNWGGTGALTSAFTQVGAFAIPPGSRDAALVATLAHGDYSVRIESVTGGAGQVLVEVYEVP